MDINRIRYFLTLAKTGSITQAATFHRISPPAFSKAMQVFETEVGQKLTVPDGRGLRLTDAARELVEPLTEIVSKVDAIRERNDDRNCVSSHPKVLKLATFEVFSTHVFERLFQSTFSDHGLTLYELGPGKLEVAVANRTVDFGLTYVPIPHPELDFLRISRIEMGIYGRHDTKRVVDHAQMPFAVPIFPLEGAPNRVQGLDGWPDDAFPRTIRYRVQMMETALGICRRGLGFAYLPKIVARLHNETVKPGFALREIKEVANPPGANGFIYLVKRKSDHEGAAAKKIAAAIRRLCSETTA